MNMDRTFAKLNKLVDIAITMSGLILMIVVIVSFLSQLNSTVNVPVDDVEEMASNGVVTVDENGIHYIDLAIPVAGASRYLVDLSSMWEE